MSGNLSALQYAGDLRAQDRQLARLELDELKAAVRWLAKEKRQPDTHRLDPITADALAQIARLLTADEAALENPLLLRSSIAPGETRFLVLAKAERYQTVRAASGPFVAAEMQSVLKDRLAQALPTARMGRMAGGVVEFSIVCRTESIGAILEELHSCLELPFALGQQTFTSAILLGATAASNGTELIDAIAQAEQSLARAAGLGVKFAVHCEREEADASERLALMRDLRAAERDNELTVVYQPKLNLRSREFDSAEALVRWRHSERGDVAPDRFIELAEESGDIGPITLNIVAQVVRDQVKIAETSMPPLIYVNLSGRLVADEEVCERILEILQGAVGRIGLEITETAVIAEPKRALGNLHKFVKAGIAIAIDDYGSGLSSLAYLKTLPATELKIDREFIKGLTSTQRDPLIVRSTIDLAHALEMEVTAEGVDDPSALALLQMMGCDRVQGYLLSRPLELPALIALLQEPVSEALFETPKNWLFARGK